MSEACKKVIADFLIEASKKDRNIVVLCSDSRGSAALGPYAVERKEQFIEVGIAEQNHRLLCILQARDDLRQRKDGECMLFP